MIFARVAALDAEWNVLGSSGIVNITSEEVSSDTRPIAEVKHTGTVVINEEGTGEGYSLSLTHSDFPGESIIFGMPVGWHTALGCAMLVGLWIAARHI